jgi:hypothetical protein
MCAGGGGVKSDDVTAKLANVLEGKTALTSDSDDDIGTGTMPECGAITLAPTGNNTLTSGGGHYDSVTADGSLAYAAGFSAKTLHRVSIGSGGNGTYSATSIPNYSSLTADNFAFVVTYGNSYYYSQWTAHSNSISFSPSITYDANTGIVTVSKCSASYREQSEVHNASVTGNVYCFYAG